MKKKIHINQLVLLLFLGVLITVGFSKKNKTSSTEGLSKTSQKNKIMVVAHRADWRGAPENSLLGIQRCITMGVDMIEIDLKRTKDGTIIIMHDKTLDRTTTGSGIIKDTSFETIKGLFLKKAYGMPSTQKVPTLKEVLELCKGKVLVFLDKAYKYLPEVIQMVEEMDMSDQVYYEGKKPLSSLKKEVIQHHINYMPRVRANSDYKSYVVPFLKLKKELIFIFSFEKKDTDHVRKTIKKIKNKGKIMLAPLWEDICGGYTDDAALYDPEGNWGKILDLGTDYICTDRPSELISYLKRKGLHD